jgi:hypothetical protein
VLILVCKEHVYDALFEKVAFYCQIFKGRTTQVQSGNAKAHSFLKQLKFMYHKALAVLLT